MKSQERRGYYRINDTVGLRYTVLNLEPQISDGTGMMNMPLGSLLREIDAEINRGINVLWKENELVAQTLGLLNRKLSLVASHDLGQDSELESYEELVVSLSGSGIGFDCKQELSVGDHLSLSLALRPSNINIAITGVVSRCERLHAATEDCYWVRVVFDDDTDGAQEQLIQHVLQRQFATVGRAALVTALEKFRGDAEI